MRHFITPPKSIFPRAVEPSSLLTVVQGLVARLDEATAFMAFSAKQGTLHNPQLSMMADSNNAFIEEMALAGLFSPFVVKIQRPVASNAKVPEYLIYNEDRSFTSQLEIAGEVHDLFGDDYKIYAKVRLWGDGVLQIVERIEDQPW